MEAITPVVVLKVPEIVNLSTSLLLHDYFNADKHSNLNLSLVSELHDYNTQSVPHNLLSIPSFRTNLRKFCPTVIDRYIWSDIPQPIREKPTKQMFEKALSHNYLNQYYNSSCTLSF